MTIPTFQIFRKYFWLILPLFICCYYLISQLNSNIILGIDVDMPDELRKTEQGQIFYERKRGNGFNEKDSISFHYKQYEKGEIINVSIPNTKKIGKIRFDPFLGKGIIIINRLIINNGLSSQTLSLEKLYKSSNNFVGLHSIDNIEFKDGKVSIYCSNNDPSLFLFKDFSLYKDWKMTAFLAFLVTLLLSIFTLLFFHYYSNKIFHYFHKYSFNVKLVEHSIVTALSLLIIAIIVTKSFVSLVTIFHFERELTLIDMLVTYVSDIGIVFVLGIFAIYLFLLAKWIASEAFQKIITLILTSFLKILQQLIYLSLLGLSLAFVSLSIFYLFSGYIFFEWGAFIEPQHIEAIEHIGVTDEFWDLFFRWQTGVFLIVLISLTFLAYKIAIYLNKYKLRILAIFLPISLIALLPINHIYNFAPSVYSPLLMITASTDENTDGVPKELLEDINASNFKMEIQAQIPLKYQHYKGIAKDMNVVIVVLESTRQQNINLYGYERQTMPFLSQLAENSIVFHNARVNQPRSCKTMESLTLGVYPEPRLRAITWRHEKVNGKNNLLKTILDQGYTFNFTTMLRDYGGDSFYPFLKKITNNRIDHAMTQKKFIQAGKLTHQMDDKIASNDLLEWTAKQQKFLAMLWTNCAHMPYNSPIKPYGEENTIDKYDNCLANLDLSIKILVNGLQKQGKLDNTLILILGDHGEALGEKLELGHGNFLYEHSLRIPFLIYNPKIFSQPVDLKQRFQVKDIPATLLYLLGLPNTMEQSINIFAKTATDKIYLSNVFTDYKLGMIFKHYKFVYRPKYDKTYLYDLIADPNEEHNIIGGKTDKEIAAMKRETLEWYKYQIEYLDQTVFAKE
ncbi:hypothetical protein PN36_24310 [Candidatus Thiomargarita nelsonii]|uniref:Sulfatase N-terminal domain-containing protein n=1 Tax=Candidatus Thiomargarita nelsonii TaxID=1003181 RepID=A0A0A6PK47_9GAMM|nr:hypothetical protein PN36_24310 [Candidatus Thiomargarita nelsonii]